jgi:hypothetical protein
VERSLWREDGCVVYKCCWPSPAKSFSGPSLVELVTIVYCLRFETCLFVATYDSQSYAGGIRSRLPTGEWYSGILSHIATDGQSVCLTWCRAPSVVHDQILVTVWQFLFCPWGAPSLTRGWVCLLSESVSSNHGREEQLLYVLLLRENRIQITASNSSSSVLALCCIHL